MTLGREIIGQRHGKTQTVPVAEWGGEITIRQLSHREVVTIQGIAADAIDGKTQKVKDRGKLTRFTFELIKRSWVDADGELVLTDADYDTLIDEPNSVIKAISEAVSDFNGLNDAAQAEEKKD